MPGALQHAEKNGEMKERAAAGAIAGCFGSRDESDDRVAETEDADLAHEIGRRPSHGENAESGGAEQARDEKREDAAKIRGEHRDEICPRAAFQLRAMIDGIAVL